MRRLFAAVLFISTAAIAYEILLMRMLSIVQWHHFAWMVISLALLGYGLSGAMIALARRRIESHFADAFSASALLFSMAMVVCWVLAQKVPFNALQVVWSLQQLYWLGLLYLLFMLPFLFAALCLGMAFTLHGGQAGRIYFFDLLGAGAGAALVIAALFHLDPEAVLMLLATLALAGALLMAPQATVKLSAGAWAVLLVWTHASGLNKLEISEFKGLTQALQTTGSQVVDQVSGPLGQLTVVSNDTIPFRQAPGLSITARHVPPEQLAVFRDGGGLSAMTRWSGQNSTPGFLGAMTSALPYRMLAGPSVLVLGAGTGMGVLQALHLGATKVDAVELDPNMASLVRDRFSDFTGMLYRQPHVNLHIGEARGFVARSLRRYDLVQIDQLDAFAVSGAGIQALNENYLYTAEAIGDYLALLNPGGLLSITRWVKVPPRDSLKLVNLVATALRDSGVLDPGRRLAMVRGWSTVTLLVKNGEFSSLEIASLKSFAQRLSFDTVHYPGMPADHANRYNRLERPWFQQGVSALLGPAADAFVARYKFNIEAPTDERPYFYDFFRWPVFLEALSLRERGGAALLEWGYLVPAATLVQATLVGFLLILLPLIMAQAGRPGPNAMRPGAYFFLLGLAFLFVEIAFIQKFTLFLSHPLYAIAVVLAGFLVFAGIGSIVSEKLAVRARSAGYSAIRVAVFGIALVTVTYLVLLPWLFGSLLAWGEMARVGVSLLLIAPLALFMGMPFPLGLRHLAQTDPTLIPSAWGINGYASVISAALASLLAVSFGFTVVLLAALALYAGAAILAPKP